MVVVVQQAALIAAHSRLFDECLVHLRFAVEELARLNLMQPM
jgi:hypothetical protein